MRAQPSLDSSRMLSMRAALALLLLPSLAAADIDEKGVRAGSVYTGADHDGVKPSPGITGGAFIVQRFAPNFGLQIESLFERQTFDLHPNNTDEGTFHLYAIEAPVLARLDVAPQRFYLAAGVGPVVSLGGVRSVMTSERVDEINSFNLAAQVGIGIEVPAGPGRITIDARYRHLLFDLSDTGNFINEPNAVKQSHMILVCVGYGFP